MADADPLQQFEQWAGGLLAKMEPAARTRLTRAVAKALRRSQQQRIAQQRNPDGSPFEPRKPKPRLRDKSGRLKRQHTMFAKLRQARFLRATGTAEAAVVAFTGRAARIARVHQYGLIDAVAPGGPRVRYPVRELLGFSAADRALVRDLLVEHLSD